MAAPAVLLVALLALLSVLQSVQGLVHHLNIHHDDRHIFKIETFGFLPGGKIDLTVKDFNIQAGKVVHNITHGANTKYDPVDLDVRRRLGKLSYDKAGFVLRHSESESLAQQDLEFVIERKECIFEKLEENDIILDLSKSDSWKHASLTHEVTIAETGFYTLIFAHCSTVGPLYVGFKLDAAFSNPGPNYLSAGDAPLPVLYLGFFVLFSVLTIAWLRQLYCNPHTAATVHTIHYFMLALVVLKTLTLLCESIRFHYIAETGVQGQTWDAIYFIFATLKGVLLFVVILLIGMGYSLIKNFLSDRERTIIWVVLALQVVDNVAMVVLEETSPGSVGYLTWKDVLHLVDILCCFAILLPIVWSIRHLRQAAEVDGKAHNNLTKLTQFRHFYILTLVYIYFTRIAVYLLEATVPFQYLWAGPFFSEVAAVIFYTHTGYSFRPSDTNPYLPVKASEESAAQEYGLEDDDDDEGLELPASRRAIV